MSMLLSIFGLENEIPQVSKQGLLIIPLILCLYGIQFDECIKLMYDSCHTTEARKF